MSEFKILYIDDDDMDIELLQTALDMDPLKDSFSLETCGDPDIAMKLIEKIEKSFDVPLPSVILLDLHLPRLDGWTLLKILKASDRLKTVPVFLMSSTTVPEDNVRAQELGAANLRTKPANMNDYRTLIQSIYDACKTSHN